MGLNCGIVGLPNVGKSTIFNALTSAKAASANYPFCTIDPNKGIVAVPDQRLDNIAEIITTEKIVPTTVEFVDMDTVEKRLTKNEKLVKTGDKNIIASIDVLKKVRDGLNSTNPVRLLTLTDEERKHIEDLHLMTAKPGLYVINVFDYDKDKQYIDIVADYSKKENSQCVVISGDIESEIAQMEPQERKTYYTEMGIEESGLEKLIRGTYSLLGLITYFTAGPKEVKAWTIKQGTKAPQAAGVIHSDFERGFICAGTDN